MPQWISALELNEQREVVSGNAATLCDAIRNAAELRVGTVFAHNEHIDTSSSSSELVREFMDFRITYLLEDRWAAGIENLRMPIGGPDGFGPRASMSFFLYNQDGTQACGRPYLDGVAADGPSGESPLPDTSDMPKMNVLSNFDTPTNAPSRNFIYDFNMFRFMVRDEWQQVLAHDSDGQVQSGSVDALVDAFSQGCEVKVAVAGLCEDLAGDGPAIDHEVFVHAGPCYYYTEAKLFMTGANPTVRVRPAIPMLYASRGWDFGWLFLRSDGFVARWLCDPYTLQFNKSESRHALRWFVRH